VIWSETGIPKDYKWYDLDARKTDVSIYAKLQQNIAEHWHLFGDLQYRHVDYNIDGFRNNPKLTTRNRYNFLNPKAGISYSTNTLKAYFSYALGNKEPNRDDFEAGALNRPKFETLNDFELGVEKKAAGFSWAVTGYYMAYSNQLALTGQINDVGAYTRTNIPRSYRAGLELQGSVKILPWMFVNGNLTLSKNRVTKFSEFVDDYDNGGQKSFSYRNAPIAFSPDVVSSLVASIVPFTNAEVSLIVKYVGRQYLDNTGNKSRSLADYYVQDLRVMYGFATPAFKTLNLVLQVNNLCNRMYEPNGYTYSYISAGSLQTENYVFPMAGINWMVGVNVKL
jgi:iron complex outermembrane receptor protein